LSEAKTQSEKATGNIPAKVAFQARSPAGRKIPLRAESRFSDWLTYSEYQPPHWQPELCLHERHRSGGRIAILRGLSAAEGKLKSNELVTGDTLEQITEGMDELKHESSAAQSSPAHA
jgi:hypothetical protein